jgi:hypothetical protein
MAAAKSPKPETATDKVVRASRSVDRAIGHLVGLLGDDDRLVVAAAFEALDRLGTRAIVGPLAEGLGRASSPMHRAYIIGGMLHYDQEGSAGAVRALLTAAKKDQHPNVAGLIQAGIQTMMIRDIGSRRAPIPSSPAGELAGS